MPKQRERVEEKRVLQKLRNNASMLEKELEELQQSVVQKERDFRIADLLHIENSLEQFKVDHGFKDGDLTFALNHISTARRKEERDKEIARIEGETKEAKHQRRTASR